MLIVLPRAKFGTFESEKGETGEREREEKGIVMEASVCLGESEKG